MRRDVMVKTFSWWYSFRVNGNARTWREAVGIFLRELADVIDGRRTLAIEMLSIPPVPLNVQTDCLRKGAASICWNFKEAAENEAKELALKATQPSLFEA